MKKVTTIDDIERDRREREREEFKRKVSGDMRKIFDGVFKPQKKVKKKKNWLLEILIWLGILLLALFIINFILFNIWAFKKLVESLFGI